MPIVWNKETKNWEITDITPEEAESILQIGKDAIVRGLGQDYYRDRSKEMLTKLKQEQFFNA